MFDELKDAVQKSKLVDITKANIKIVEALNNRIFPVVYGDSYYRQLLLSPPGLAKIVYVANDAAGIIVCRLDAFDDMTDPDLLWPGQEELAGGSGGHALYISALGLVVPYRGLGLGTMMMECVKAMARNAFCKYVYLHVQTSNLDALRYYKRHGFAVVRTIKDYYRRIKPTSAHLLVWSVPPISATAVPSLQVNGSGDNR